MNNICEALQESSGFVHQWLIAQPSVKEESLTDWLLYDISRKVPSVLYHAFTRHQEAKETGADWEWWILFKRVSFCLRVQAKKVSPSKDNYPELARTNRYGLQIDMLLDGANKANAIAMYALYSSQDLPTMCGKPSSRHDGVFLAGASCLNKDFITGTRRRIDPTDLLSRSVPFPCIACCPLVEGLGVVRMLNFFKKYFAFELGIDSERSDTIVIPRGLHSQLPVYVSSLLEFREKGIPDWWEGEFQFRIREFNAILIYDFRDWQDAGKRGL